MKEKSKVEALREQEAAESVRLAQALMDLRDRYHVSTNMTVGLTKFAGHCEKVKITALKTGVVAVGVVGWDCEVEVFAVESMQAGQEETHLIPSGYTVVSLFIVWLPEVHSWLPLKLELEAEVEEVDNLHYCEAPGRYRRILLQLAEEALFQDEENPIFEGDVIKCDA